MRMKSTTGLFAIAFILAASLALFAREGEAKKAKPEKKDNPPKTLINYRDISLSGYGAPVYKFSPVGETYGHFVGGRGGLIIDDVFVIGGGGYGLVYPDRREKFSGETYSGTEPYVHMGYGGGLLELHVFPKSLFHISAGVLIGAGGISFDSELEDESDDRKRHGDSFFVAEPEVSIYVNITRFLRIGIGASYRYVNGINSDELSDSDFRGPTAQVMFAFGWF
jgi:hypothetical protein